MENPDGKKKEPTLGDFSRRDASIVLAKKSGHENVTYVPNKEILTKKLKELKQKLNKPFKSEFIDSLCYLIEIEYNQQVTFDNHVLKFQWTRLDYFLQQLKKICKQKNHLLLLVNGMLLNQVKTGQFKSDRNSVSFGHTADTNGANFNLVNEIDNLENLNEDYFSLTKIIVRFLFKMLKFNLIDPKKRSEILKPDNEQKANNLQLLLLSCLADLCHYEELRAQVIQ